MVPLLPTSVAVFPDHVTEKSPFEATAAIKRANVLCDQAAAVSVSKVSATSQPWLVSLRRASFKGRSTGS